MSTPELTKLSDLIVENAILELTKLSDLIVENAILEKKNAELRAIWEGLDKSYQRLGVENNKLYQVYSDCKKHALEIQGLLAILREALPAEAAPAVHEVLRRIDAELTKALRA